MFYCNKGRSRDQEAEKTLLKGRNASSFVLGSSLHCINDWQAHSLSQHSKERFNLCTDRSVNQDFYDVIV